MTNRPLIAPQPFIDTTQSSQADPAYPVASDVVLVGTWNEIGYSILNGAWGNVSKSAEPASVPTPKATYKFTIPAAGRYRLLARIPAPKAGDTRNAAVPIRVNDAGSVVTFFVNQTLPALGRASPKNGVTLYSDWYTVGDVMLASGANDVVIDTAGLANSVVIDALRFVPLSAVAALPFDVDGNGACEANVDALLVMRYLLGLRGDSLIAGITLNTQLPRSDATSISSYLDGLGNTLDIDEDSAKNALTDGLMFWRYTKQLTGAALTNAARAPRLNGTTKSDADIKNYFDSKCLSQ